MKFTAYGIDAVKRWCTVFQSKEPLYLCLPDGTQAGRFVCTKIHYGETTHGGTWYIEVELTILQDVKRSSPFSVDV